MPAAGRVVWHAAAGFAALDGVLRERRSVVVSAYPARHGQTTSAAGDADKRAAPMDHEMQRVRVQHRPRMIAKQPSAPRRRCRRLCAIPQSIHLCGECVHNHV